MIEKAKAELGRVEVVSFHINLFHGVVHVIGELRIECASSASLVLVGGNVRSVWHESAQAVSCDDLRG